MMIIEGQVFHLSTMGWGFVLGTDQQQYFLHPSYILSGKEHLRIGAAVKFLAASPMPGKAHRRAVNVIISPAESANLAAAANGGV
jgi:hypothetical protein